MTEMCLVGKRILVIEDNAENRRLFQAILKLDGAEVLEADRAQRGIEIAEKEQPDIILMDIHMPEMDGVTATRLLRSLPLTSAIPIVAVSASVMEKDRNETLEAGCVGHIPKPIDPSHLVRTGGGISAASRERVGDLSSSSMTSTAEITSNYSDQPAAGADATPEAPTTPAGRVLIVDDLPANVRLLEAILKVEGHTVFTAQSGEEALALLTETETDPDVVLLDIMMPGMDGYEVCRRIRNEPGTATIPVVIVSALHESLDRVRALEAGADDFLTKPVDNIEVIARVKSLVRTKRQRDDLERAYADLQRLEELRNNLTAMIVHDLRTPLSTILAPLEMLRTSQLGELEETQQQIVEMCSRSAYRLMDLINELLDIGKMESGELVLERTIICVPDLLAQALQEVEVLASEKSIALLLDTAADVPCISADTDLMRRTLVNLLANAIKFSPNDSTVTISVAVASPELGIEQPDAKSLLFSVNDEGEGIPLEFQGRIFDKFGQVASKAGRKMSTGLGLTFCKLAVEAHGGKIWVESSPGAGSTFRFVIPLGMAA